MQFLEIIFSKGLSRTIKQLFNLYVDNILSKVLECKGFCKQTSLWTKTLAKWNKKI